MHLSCLLEICSRPAYNDDTERECQEMPALSMFYGIIVRMQSEKGGKHHKPHIHALYGDEEIVIALDGEILGGHVPNR